MIAPHLPILVVVIPLFAAPICVLTGRGQPAWLLSVAVAWLTFAAAIPAIISGGIAERARFWPQVGATAILVSLVYPFFEGIVWNGNLGIQDWMTAAFDDA